MTSESFTGVVVDWNVARGFGWIARDDGEPDAFIHIRECLTENDELAIGSRVRFKFGENRRTGRLQAYDCATIATESPDAMSVGTITTWDSSGRFFFIKPDDDSEDVFSHCSALSGDASVGARVKYAYGTNPRTGRPRALVVRRMDDEASSSGIETLQFMKRRKEA